MALGKSHEKFNLLLGAIFLGLLIGLGATLVNLLCFAGGWFIGTYIFHPDSDLGPKRTAGLLRIFLYPYSLFFKHRGLSHHWLWGTLTRLFYSCLVFFIFHLFLFHGNYVSEDPLTLVQEWVLFFQDFDWRKPHYQVFLFAFFGLYGADLSHLLLDFLSDRWKRFWRFFWGK